MTFRICLSTADLQPFFEDRHVALASDLACMGNELARRQGHGIELARRLARDLGENYGLYSLLVPESAGGFPVGAPRSPTFIDLRSVCLAREMLGQVSPLADAIFAVQGLGAYPLALAGSHRQRTKILSQLVTGKAIAAFALTEPGAGSDVASLATTARKDGNHYVLDGEKIFISNAGIATHYIVFANANPSAKRDGITAFVVEHDARGLSIEPMATSTDHPLGRLRFDGCRVPEEAIVGEVGMGFQLAMQTLDTFRVSVGAAAVGMARRALDEAIAHVTQRRQFGRLLCDQQLVKGHVADMATELDASRLLVYRAAWQRDRGTSPITKEAAMAKLFATEAAFRIIDSAVQLLGGRGVVEESTVERLYREVRPLRIYEGTSEIQRVIIANNVLQGRRTDD